MITDNDFLGDMVDEILATDDKNFTDWEIRFLDEMKLLGYYDDFQTEKINRLYERYM